MSGAHRTAIVLAGLAVVIGALCLVAWRWFEERRVDTLTVRNDTPYPMRVEVWPSDLFPAAEVAAWSVEDVSVEWNMQWPDTIVVIAHDGEFACNWSDAVITITSTGPDCRGVTRTSAVRCEDVADFYDIECPTPVPSPASR
jgi:hypothetical protein